MKNKRFDFKSIKFKLWVYFTGFGVIILLLIWGLQFFFLNSYYSEMKMSQTVDISNEIQNRFEASRYNKEVLESIVSKESTSNDLTIYIYDVNANEYLVKVIAGNFMVPESFYNLRYSTAVSQLNSKLDNGTLNSASLVSEDKTKQKTVGYATYLRDNQNKRSYIIYVFSPLAPVQSTINILRSQLIYVTIIAVLLSLAMALYLSSRISRPIKSITVSAAKMGKGNYGVKFRGGHFTEISELADTLTQAEGELEKTDMYQKDLIANVSHDLRTPLTMIKSYAEMVRDLSGNNPAKRGEHLSVIIEEADRLNMLVTDMLNLSRMQSKRIVLEKKTFDLGKATDSIIASYEILTESDSYEIIFNREPGPFFIKGDEAKIKQVMNNLINNAVKYCGEDKQIIIGLTGLGRKVRFYVTDHGEGIAPDEISHVWERYYKSSTHHVRSTEGSGLGLSIVKEILTLHKADFDVKSTLGEGSTFWFEIPLEKKHAGNVESDGARGAGNVRNLGRSIGKNIVGKSLTDDEDYSQGPRLPSSSL